MADPGVQRQIRDALAPPTPADPLPRTGVVGYESATAVYSLSRSSARLVGTLFQDLKAYDATNVPLSGGVVLVANHQSYIDPVFIAAKLPRALTFLAKSELFEPPGLRWLIRQCNAFPVRQGTGDVGAMKQSIAMLQGGKALLVFPEGSRTETGELQPIASGAALVIKRARVPVVPVAIEGAFDVWPKHRKLPRMGRVRIRFGPPMILHDRDGRAIVGRIESELRRMIGELRALRDAERSAGALPRREVGP